MEQNTLYPIFLKTEKLRVLIVGGGRVAEEKLRFLTKSSPKAQITLVAPFFRRETLALAKSYETEILLGMYSVKILAGKHIVIATTDKPKMNLQIYQDCRKRNILVNVADHPDLCDFYMGGIVTKGQLKLAISTNGKSPTVAKRLRQFFEAVLPDDIDTLLQNLRAYRDTMKTDFERKVNAMNKATETLIKNLIEG